MNCKFTENIHTNFNIITQPLFFLGNFFPLFFSFYSNDAAIYVIHSKSTLNTIQRIHSMQWWLCCSLFSFYFIIINVIISFINDVRASVSFSFLVQPRCCTYIPHTSIPSYIVIYWSNVFLLCRSCWYCCGIHKSMIYIHRYASKVIYSKWNWNLTKQLENYSTYPQYIYWYWRRIEGWFSSSK